MSAPAPATAAPAASAPASSRPSALRLFLVLVVLVAIAPTFMYPVFVMKLLCFAVFACAFNLLFGFGGLLSFGHAAFFGSAAYTAAYTTKYLGAPPELAIIAGAALAAALGLVFGALAIRIQGIYFAMITLALAQSVYFFSLRFPAFTGGEDGISSVRRGMMFGVLDTSNDTTMYIIVATISVASIVLIHRIVHSPFGQVLKAIKDNEQRVISAGYRVRGYKLTVFVLSAALSGVAGAMKALVFQLATLTDVHWSVSGEVMLMTLLGGAGSVTGPIWGTVMILGLNTYLAHLGSWLTVIQGLVFIFCVLVLHDGIAGTLQKLWRKYSRRLLSSRPWSRRSL